MASPSAALAQKRVKICGKFWENGGRVTETQPGKYRSTPRVRFASRATGASPPALQLIMYVGHSELNGAKEKRILAKKYPAFSNLPSLSFQRAIKGSF